VALALGVWPTIERHFLTKAKNHARCFVAPKIRAWENATPALLVFFLGLSICTSGICAAQQPQLSVDKRSQMEAAVAKFMSSTHVPGVSVAVVENSQYEWASGG